MKRFVGFMIVACWFVLVGSAFAAPQKVNFQGKLTDAAGNPITANVSMTFRIYDVVSGGTALWTETQTVAVTNGIYNVQLGKNNPIDTELTETKPLWLGVKVGNDAEMAPRVELTPGLYDLIILNAMTIKNGNIGIGTANPALQIGSSSRFLHIAGSQSPGIVLEDLSVGEQFFLYNYQGRFTLFDATDGVNRFVIDTSGNVGIGATSLGLLTGSSTRFLQISGSRSPGVLLDDTSTGEQLFLYNYEGRFTIFDATDGENRFVIDASGNVDIDGTLHVTGADLAEPFDMTDIASLELGDVVVIDPLNPLHVTKSGKAYDTTVAGIVSSTTQAGYVAGSRSDGSSDKPIALVGRVLCNVSGENGAINIGDLLTTAATPGHAMKATDFEKRQGAILGKALQAFDGKTGQIMVLVTLQ